MYLRKTKREREECGVGSVDYDLKDTICQLSLRTRYFRLLITMIGQEAKDILRAVWT